MKDRTSYSEWICFVAGGLAGATVALLWAPRSGNDTRRRIGRTLRDAADDARDVEDGIISRIEEAEKQAQRADDEAISTAAERIGLGKVR